MKEHRYGYEEIAQACGKDVNTVRVASSRGLFDIDSFESVSLYVASCLMRKSCTKGESPASFEVYKS